MAISQFLSHQEVVKQDTGVDEERLEPIMDKLRLYISYWREYPDMFVDFMQTGGDVTKHTTFNLFFYQRVFLRVAMRYKYVYCVFPRESKRGK